MRNLILKFSTMLIWSTLAMAAAAQQPEPEASAKKPVDAKSATKADAATQADKIVEARAKLEKTEAAHPGNSAEVIDALDNLIGLELDEHLVTEQTLAEVKREVQAAESLKGAHSTEYMVAVGEQIEVLAGLGRQAEARPIAERLLELTEKERPNSDEASTAANDLGFVCSQLGDFICATRGYERALAISRKISGDKSADLISPLNNIGALKFQMGDVKGAVEAEEESLALEYQFEPDSSHVCVTENNVGAYYIRMPDFDKALAHLDRAIALVEKSYGPNSPMEMQIYHNRANLFTRMGRFTEAWKAYEYSLANTYESADSEAATRAMYANSLAQGGDYKKSLEQSLKSAKVSREIFVLQARTLPERQALAYEATRPHAVDMAISVLLKHSDAPVDAIYQEVVRSRALVADEMARRQRNLNTANDPEVERLLKELDQARTDRLSVETGEAGRENRAEKIYVATARMEAVERSLAEHSAALRNDVRIEQVGIDDVRHNLPEHSVLISYVAYRSTAVDRHDPTNTGKPSYAAFVLHPDSSKIALIDLGDAASIDEMVRKTRAAADAEAHSGGLGSIRNERVYRANGFALRKRVWDPLAAEVQSAHMIFVVADGNLNLIPFAGLPQGDGYMVEHGPVIHMVSSERDLVPAMQQGKHQGLFAIGSPAFEMAANKLPAAPVLRGGEDQCDAFGQTSLQALPGTAAEVSDIGATWKRWNAAERAQLVTGSDATLGAFLTGASQSRVLHVATHAFLEARHCKSSNPLLHSGFVFAGGKHGGTQSILTAQQIASLDLSGVDWAVLSACNTGIGEMRDGEGVLGLQRAFRVAGARSVIMTLWPVDDEAAREFMHELYTERLSKHATTADAVWDSSRQLLLDRRKAGKSTHPWYWAGFVGSGGWE